MVEKRLECLSVQVHWAEANSSKDFIALEVADFGVVKEDGDGVCSGEVVLLKANSVDSVGSRCVAEMGERGLL
jgi:hypothetical protein